MDDLAMRAFCEAWAAMDQAYERLMLHCQSCALCAAEDPGCADGLGLDAAATLRFEEWGDAQRSMRNARR